MKPNTQFGISFTEEKRNSYHCFLSRCLFMFFNILRKNGNFSAIALDFWVASFYSVAVWVLIVSNFWKSPTQS
ncbi:hypothetical protein [Dactylococcopsis salina]|uniref:Uncharacterized protein n=1 Tax=Dactylococcopsis salina (strain PCC 8305) TaxID=13035 RepID=K9YWE8_DACS8|nr:hypothetical protein [Dactylococcopsis salina]AFZ50448.1 hypothetical protein Dacsa_1790 [Dactylococcopsis salina PCC 8305]